MTVTLVRLHTLATSRLKGDRGQGSLEYIGILLVIAVVVGALVTAIDGLATKAMAPKPVLELPTHHIHAPAVSVREQAGIVVDRLRRSGTLTFRALCGDSPDTLTTVARFLSLLEGPSSPPTATSKKTSFSARSWSFASMSAALPASEPSAPASA